MKKAKPHIEFLKENNACLVRLIDANCKVLHHAGGGELFRVLNKANANFRKMIAENQKLITEMGG